MLFLVATNVVASRPPERRPTGTLHACANIKLDILRICEPVHHHLSLHIYSSSTPGGGGASIGALIVLHSLVGEGEDAVVARGGGADLGDSALARGQGNKHQDAKVSHSSN